jgi:hypothetical protein
MSRLVVLLSSARVYLQCRRACAHAFGSVISVEAVALVSPLSLFRPPPPPRLPFQIFQRRFPNAKTVRCRKTTRPTKSITRMDIRQQRSLPNRETATYSPESGRATRPSLISTSGAIPRQFDFVRMYIQRASTHSELPQGRSPVMSDAICVAMYSGRTYNGCYSLILK